MITNPKITKILNIKSDDILKYRDKMECSLLDAKKNIEFEKLMCYIDNLKSMEEIKNVLKIITLRIY